MGARTESMSIGKPAVLVFCIVSAFCASPQGTDRDGEVVVFKHGKIAGDPAPFNRLLDEFEARNPGISVRDEILPASTDEQHQFYVVNLEGKSPDFDVLSMDVIWVPEFARAGWLTDLSGLVGPEEREDFFPGPMKAVTYRDKIWAVPWYIDAGVLYYRKDLLEKHGFSPPRLWSELVSTAQSIQRWEPGIYGFIWQGKQYEGLVCNILEYFWSNGGDIFRGGEVVIASRENIAALEFIRALIVEHRVTPPLVLTAIEEPTRHLFGGGKALFMRNWPYAWNIFEQEDSPVRGKVGVAPMPSFPGGESASTLGGWQLGLNRYAKNPDAARKLIRFLTRSDSQKILALTLGYKPTRRSLYADEELRAAQPFIAGLYDVFMAARPRPVTPYYMMITQVMQPEFSAAVSGIKTAAEALGSAGRQIEHILKVEE